MRACPKPEPRKKAKTRRQRHEAKVKRDVRANVSARDGYCRLWWLHDPLLGPCRGESEWMHLWDKKRARTRSLPAEERHTTEASAMGCTAHHRAEEAGELVIEALTLRLANGLLRFTRGGYQREEVRNER